MSIFFNKLTNAIRIHSYRIPFFHWKCLYFRKLSDVPKKFLTFDEVIAQRRLEAKRSIVIQVHSQSSFNDLYGYCSRYASINGVYHYKNSASEHFMLIEFSTEENLRNLLQCYSAHQKDLSIVALRSPFLWFRALPEKYKETTQKPEKIDYSTLLKTIDGNLPLDDSVLLTEMGKCSSTSDQIQMLYDKTKLNDLEIRLRYMVAQQLEVVFGSLYANISFWPFGSSVNGFGKMGCDLDLILTNLLTEEMSKPDKRLVYQDKKSEDIPNCWQRHLQLVADVLELRIPGANKVQRILGARVPIVKYVHDFADVDCDICYNNTSGLHMTELLWLYGNMDHRVRPLVFTIRRWAKTVGLTNHFPGKWITNFSLTLMVIFFLQQNSKDGFILPSLKYLSSVAGKQDTKEGENGANYTFLRDLNVLPQMSYSQCSLTLETLLLQFFEFYAQFDFKNKAISIIEGSPIRKLNSSPLYIENPLEKSLNVSRNVSLEECQRLNLAVKNAAWLLESGLDKYNFMEVFPWGIIGLIDKNYSQDTKKPLVEDKKKQKMLLVKDLFNDKSLQNEADDIKNKIEKSKSSFFKEFKNLNAKSTVKFKNTSLKKQITKIRKNKIV